MKICITRFNNITYQENLRFREINNIKCIYGVPRKNSDNILPYITLIVLELNIEINQIIGIGIITNNLTYKRYKIYNDNNYNRYIYQSNKRIDRLEFTSDELIQLNILEIKLCTTKKNIKRGSGIQILSIHLKDNIELTNFIINMCKKRYKL